MEGEIIADHPYIDDSVSTSQSKDDEEEEDRNELPLIGQKGEKVSSTWTLMNFLRGMIGPGCLALPLAVKYSGSWAGLILIFVLGFLNLHCMMMLVHCAQFLCEKSGKLELDYGHLAKKAFDYGPMKFRPYSKRALYITNTVISIPQLGICAVQLVFMSSHIKEVLEHSSDNITLAPQIYLLIIIIPVILVNYIKSLSVLAFLSTAGNILMVLDFIVIFQAIVSKRTLLGDLPSVTSASGMVLASGSILYAFEGQAMILPMENRMKHPKAMIGWNGVLSTGMSVTTIIYGATGFFGYSAYGNDALGSITLNLPNTVLYDIVKLILVLVIYLGFPIQAYVIIETLWPAIKRKLKKRYSSARLLVMQYIFRTVLVLVTLVIAVSIPELELIIPLVGISAGMLLAFIFPPFIELVTYWNVWKEEGRSNKIIWAHTVKNVLLMSLGLVGLIVGLYSNFGQIINHHSK